MEVLLFDGFGGAGIMFQIVPVIVMLGFIFVFTGIMIAFVKGIMQWKKNNHSPVLTVEATVVAKRADVRYHSQAIEHNMNHMSSHTRYYITFEVPSGDRMEFAVRDTEYGLVAKRDVGKLTFQGTRYLSFVRNSGV